MGRTEFTVQVPQTLQIFAQYPLQGCTEDSPFSPQLQSHLSVTWSQEGTMAKAAATWGNLFLVLSLFVLPNCLEPTLPTGEFLGFSLGK